MKLRDYLDVSQAQDKATFTALLVGVAADAGFGIATGGLAVDRGPGIGGAFELLGNAPAAYLAVAPSMPYSRDPVLRRLKTTSSAIWYDQSTYVAGDAIDLWDFQAPFGYRTGITVALHLPRRQHFILGFDRDQPLPKKEGDLIEMLASLQFLAGFAVDAAQRLFGDAESVSLCDGERERPLLTLRQVEVLNWTLAGKTGWEVGQILSISIDTVNFHLKLAMRKLDATSKHQAALKAARLGLLTL